MHLVDPDQRLPPELEREIFIAACSKRSDIPNLLLVAQRVRIWLEPLLYRTISLSDAPGKDALFLTAISAKPATFLAHAVRNIVLNISRKSPDAVLEQICSILRLCTGYGGIALNANSTTAYCTLFDFMNDGVPPRRLALFLRELTAAWATDPRSVAPVTPSVFPAPPPPTLPAFSRLTHLALLDGLNIDFVVGLPALTHLAVPLPGRLSEEELKTLLEGCKPLVLLVFLVPMRILGTIERARSEEEDLFAAMRDPRVVITDFRYWHDCISEDEEELPFWRIAEEFVSRKSEGKIAEDRFWTGKYESDAEPANVDGLGL